MRIETLEIAGLRSALEALRLPFNKEPRSILDYKLCIHRNGDKLRVMHMSTIDADQRDLELMSTLVKRGDEHAKVMRGIIVWAEITAPIYLWCELETYRIGHERLSSESTMHGVAKGLTGDALVRVKSELPMGTMLKKVDYFSYQALRRIVIQRHDHRLPEWRQFVEWVKTLPLSRELIFKGTCVPFDEENATSAKETGK